MHAKLCEGFLEKQFDGEGSAVDQMRCCGLQDIFSWRYAHAKCSRVSSRTCRTGPSPKPLQVAGPLALLTQLQHARSRGGGAALIQRKCSGVMHDAEQWSTIGSCPVEPLVCTGSTPHADTVLLCTGCLLLGGPPFP